MPRRIPSALYFLLLLLPLAGLVAAGAWIVAQSDYEQRLTRRTALEASDVAAGVRGLEAALDGAADDLRFLAALPRLREAMENETPAARDLLGETLAAFSRTKRVYHKVRWIDERGRERVRVDYDPVRGEARLVPAAALQDKSARYFFREAMRLAPGTLYVSPFDLNVEDGAIERPLNPTLRLAIPLADSTGQRRGIVILNLFGKRLLERMLTATSGLNAIRGRLELLDQDGYWLHANRPGDAWGFMFGETDKTLARQNPQAWAHMRSAADGQAALGDGLWSWRTVAAVSPERLGTDGALALPAGVTWRAAARMPAAEMAALHRAAWERLAWPVAIVGSLALLACAFLTVYRDRVSALDLALRNRLTEAEATTQRLAAQERFIRTITDHLPSKISYWDRDLRCRYANAAYFEWVGKRPEELLGLHMAEVFGDERFEQVRSAAEAALEGRAQRFESRVGKPGGAVGWLQTHFVPDRVGRDVEGFYGLATDITDVKRAGIELGELNAELARRVEEVLAATRAKDDFLSNMSHEIRTPLNAILGLAHLLDSRPLQPEDLDLVRKIRGAGRLLLGLINDILDWSKIEAGRLELERVPFRLGEILDGVAAIMSTAAGDKDLELAVEAVPTGAEQLLGDPLRLGQVLNNLVSNAIKFTERGAVSVHVRLLDAPPDGGQRQLRFAVRDTGVGIAPEKLEAIFEAFSQADTSTTRRFGGTGLGLSISRHLVRRMGGEIGVDSTPGRGSEFWFTVPFEPAATGFAAPGMARQRVLVVDDSAIARDTLRAIVASLGWSAETASSGAEGIALWQARADAGQPFDLALVDLQMPGMDGLATTAALRDRCSAGLRCPVIAMVTAHSRDRLQGEAGVSAADFLLSKPITGSMLYNAVAETWHRREPARATPRARAPARNGRLPGLRVLVVDDSEVNRQVAARILEREGASVATVGDGPSALDWLRERPGETDVVLMDIQMPLMDGYEATRQIRALPGRDGLPVIALTAGAFAHQREAALQAGMDDFLPKPFDIDAMVSMLRRLAMGNSAAQAGPSPEGDGGTTRAGASLE